MMNGLPFFTNKTKDLRRMKKTLTTLLLLGSLVSSHAQNLQQGDYGYLYCHMSDHGEWTAYALSRDGLHYRDLLGGKPVFNTQEHARIEGGTRDAYITRRHDGSGYLMVCTDMCVAKSKKWENYGIDLLQSDDLIHWTSVTLDFRQGPAIFCNPEAKSVYRNWSAVCRVWAPQIFWNPDFLWDDGHRGGYMIYYSMLNRSEEQYDRMYYSYADETFTRLTQPQLLFDWGYATIDADINYVPADGLYHMLIKKEGGKPGIYTATSKQLTSGWGEPVENDYVSFEGQKKCEGSSAFQLIGDDTWRVAYVEYSSRPHRYRICQADDHLRNFRDPVDIEGVSAPQHGSFMRLTREEYERMEAWDKSWQRDHELTLRPLKRGATVAPTMYGVFFEDINYGADGGLYAELIANRSFEAPMHTDARTGERISGGLQSWTTFGNVTIGTERPAYTRNPHYAVLRSSGHREKYTGLENRGYFGIGLREGLHYNFTATVRGLAGKAKIRVELVNSLGDVIAKETIDIAGQDWQTVKTVLKATQTDGQARFRLYLTDGEGIAIDHISLFPADHWNGLRADLVGALKDLHPGVFRFPGGCIVEGTDLGTRYQWKETVGPAENRPMNENRWNYTFPHRLSPDYYQSYGLGFYEYFLLAEHIGAAPLPILNCGLACQYQNRDDNAQAHVATADLQPYIQDALDLIEFANGDTTTQWGALRARMGHPAPFQLKHIGIGNEQWGPLYPERLELFVKAIRQQHPEIAVVGSSGPSAEGDKFDYGWEQMRRLGVDLVDEHYYKSPEWFRSNAARYDKYPRKGPKVFAGEYAAHPGSRRNCFEGALAEAAFMTGLERNADVVRMATYAPLFAHVEGWQWRPDLIWFDNLRSVRTPNWYVQQLYGQYKGTQVASLTEQGQPLTGADSLYASAVYDKERGAYYVKLVNTARHDKTVRISLQGIKAAAEATLTTLHAAPDAENTLERPDAVRPRTTPLFIDPKDVSLTIGRETFQVLEIKLQGKQGS